MSKPQIRARRASDLDRCVHALRTVYEADVYPVNWPSDPHGWLSPSRLLQAWIAEGSAAAVDGHIAVQELPGETRARRAELSRLFVIPAARRRSLATSLVDHVRAWAAEHDYALTLNVTDENRSAAVALRSHRLAAHPHDERRLDNARRQTRQATPLHPPHPLNKLLPTP